jgi:pyruvate dehydrogenase E2 component (dihydrolipoamide acetyltransferase)
MADVAQTDGATRDFLVPDLGEGLEEATIVEWRVAPGQAVALNQVLCSVETAKAEVEVPSPYAGTVVALGGQANETLKVGSLLARIAVDSAAGGTGGGGSTREPTLVGYGHDESIDRSRRGRRRGAGSVDTAAAGAPAVVAAPAVVNSTAASTPAASTTAATVEAPASGGGRLDVGPGDDAVWS